MTRLPARSRLPFTTIAQALTTEPTRATIYLQGTGTTAPAAVVPADVAG